MPSLASRTILRALAFVASRHAGRQLDAFLAAHSRTAQVQQHLLRRLLAAHAQTDFGRRHDFRRIHSYEDFAKAVPLHDYEDLKPYIEQVLAGRTDALLPSDDRVLMFSMTSGTTGEPKYIPVTGRFLAEMRRGWNIFGLAALRDHRGAWLRQILQISSPMDERRSPTGVPCGAISGLLAATQKRIVRRMYVRVPKLTGDTDPQAKYYTIIRSAIGRDVAFITTANPSSTIKLIETAQQHAERLIRDVADGTLHPPGERRGPASDGLFAADRKLAAGLEEAIKADGALLPRHFWNIEFLANWTGGTLGLYLPRLRELFDSAPVRDIGLLASEGRFSVPLADGTAAGVAEITGNFLEFIPAEQYGSKRPTVLRAHELDVGREYFLVVSNWAGLWRYNMDDRIRVVDTFGSSPVFEFLSRGKHTANITGEKLTEHQVVEAMRRASAAVGLQVQRFTLQGHFSRVPYYELRADVADGALAGHLAELLDRVLCELNMEYKSKRDSGRLGPVRFTRVTTREMDRLENHTIRRRGGRCEQYKHKYLLTEVLSDQHEPGGND